MQTDPTQEHTVAQNTKQLDIQWPVLGRQNFHGCRGAPSPFAISRAEGVGSFLFETTLMSATKTWCVLSGPILRLQLTSVRGGSATSRSF